jgi:hypothetical protein
MAQKKYYGAEGGRFWHGCVKRLPVGQDYISLLCFDAADASQCSQAMMWMEKEPWSWCGQHKDKHKRCKLEMIQPELLI